MCLPKSKPQKVETVAAPPAPSAPADTVASPEETTAEGSANRAKRKGRSSLRIDLASSNSGSGGTGLNIPQG